MEGVVPHSFLSSNKLPSRQLLFIIVTLNLCSTLLSTVSLWKRKRTNVLIGNIKTGFMLDRFYKIHQWNPILETWVDYYYHLAATELAVKSVKLKEQNWKKKKTSQTPRKWMMNITRSNVNALNFGINWTNDNRFELIDLIVLLQFENQIADTKIHRNSNR